MRIRQDGLAAESVAQSLPHFSHVNSRHHRDQISVSEIFDVHEQILFYFLFHDLKRSAKVDSCELFLFIQSFSHKRPSNALFTPLNGHSQMILLYLYWKKISPNKHGRITDE
ncbi:hypothetical protein AB6A40_009189 [Gnathostoma spinigerum]|uniref:Maturase K n=1 Tax=Gnathostoma spinigerum TaxID=75299 RepID=A0ABD6ESF5_9BILA